MVSLIKKHHVTFIVNWSIVKVTKKCHPLFLAVVFVNKISERELNCGDASLGLYENEDEFGFINRRICLIHLWQESRVPTCCTFVIHPRESDGANAQNAS